MNKRIIFVFSILFVFLTSLAFAGINEILTVNKFVLVNFPEQNITAYTQKNILNSNYFIGTDKYFYGSSSGEIDLNIYLISSNMPANYKIGIKTRGKNITLKKINTGQKIVSPILIITKDYIYPNSFVLDEKLKTITLTLDFNREEIGVMEELDIILYDDKNNIVQVLDPFLSGYGNRQQGTIDTVSLALSGDVTNDHMILIHLDNANDFWVNDACGDGTGITFTQSDETTELDFNVIGLFDFVGNDANIALEFTPTFTSASNPTFYFYYNGSCVDNSEGTGAYPANQIANWHMEETAGTTSDDATTNNVDLTHTNTPTLTAGGQIGKGTSYASGSSEKSVNTTFLDAGYSDMSFSIWIKPSGAQTAFAGVISKINVNPQDEPIRLRYNATTGIDFLVRAASTTIITTTTSNMESNAWYHIVGSRSSGGAQAIYVNGVLEDSDSGGGAVGAGTDEDFRLAEGATDVVYYDGLIDEVAFYNVALTANDVSIIYASQTNTLLSFGADETSVATPDFNIVAPSATGIMIKGGMVYEVSFDVQDADSNNLLIDLNYSTSSSQGTGTEIINDSNTLSGSISCVDNDFSNSTNCTYSWTTPAADGNFFMLGLASDGTNTDFDAGDNNFMIDSIPSAYLEILPDVNFTKTAYPLDFNATISDSGSGNFRCIAKVYFNGVYQAGLDQNISATTGFCNRSITSGVPSDTNVSVGFQSVDVVGNVGDENKSFHILYAPPEVTPTIPPQTKTKTRYINTRHTDVLSDVDRLKINSSKNIELLLLLIFIGIGIMSVLLWKKR